MRMAKKRGAGQLRPPLQCMRVCVVCVYALYLLASGYMANLAKEASVYPIFRPVRRERRLGADDDLHALFNRERAIR